MIAGDEARRLYSKVCCTPAEVTGGAETISSQADLAQVGPGFAGTTTIRRKK
jgi:hypothetical protein